MTKIEILIRVFKYLDSPFTFIYNHIKGRECVLKLKNGVRMTYQSGYGEIYTLMQILDKNYRISNVENNLLIEVDDNLKFIQPNAGCLNEDFNTMYLDHIDIQGKCVFDVGGFYGESAVYFSKVGGADRIFVYEPLPGNCKIIENNIKLNGLENVKVYAMGVSSENGSITVTSDSPPGSSAFGSQGGGSKYSVDINVVSWNEILLNAVENNAYLLKSDCEGAEQFILDADPQLISRIPQYIIEIHDSENARKITGMFSDLGYATDIIKKLTDQISIYKYYHRQPDEASTGLSLKPKPS